MLLNLSCSVKIAQLGLGVFYFETFKRFPIPCLRYPLCLWCTMYMAPSASLAFFLLGNPVSVSRLPGVIGDPAFDVP